MKHGIPSQRQLRMGEQVRHVLAETLRRGKFHVEILMDASFLSVNEVRMTPDLKQAKAYVSSLTHDVDMKELLAALNHEAPYFQREIAHKLDAKFTPRVQFIEDASQEAVNRLEKIFHEIEERG